MIQPITWKGQADILTPEELSRIHQASLEVDRKSVV